MGPTGAGKTDLAAALVADFPLEIVSVDAARDDHTGLAVLFGILAFAIGGAFFIAFLIVTMLVVIVAFLAAVPVAMALGELVLRDQSSFIAYLAGAAMLALGLVLLGLLPVLGGLATLLVWIVGLGAFILYFARTRHVPWTRTGPPAAPVAPDPTAPAAAS